MATQSASLKDKDGPSIAISTRGHSVRITAPREIMYDLKLVRRIEDLVLGRLGHPQCYSGFDLSWRMRDVINPAQFMR